MIIRSELVDVIVLDLKWFMFSNKLVGCFSLMKAIPKQVVGSVSTHWNTYCIFMLLKQTLESQHPPLVSPKVFALQYLWLYKHGTYCVRSWENRGMVSTCLWIFILLHNEETLLRLNNPCIRGKRIEHLNYDILDTHIRSSLGFSILVQ